MAAWQSHSTRLRRTIAVVAGSALAIAIVAIILVIGSDEVRSSDPVGVFPVPGARSASPQTEVSIRGVGADDLGEIQVAGVKSGPHPAEVREHPDGEGASLVFAKPFAAQERVTVRTELNVEGARDGDFAFQTVRRPKEGLGSGSLPPPDLLRQYAAQEGDVPDGAVPQYRSRPDLRPPEVEVRQGAEQGVGEGLIMIAPKPVFGARQRPGLQAGPLIVDDEGEPVWFRGAPISKRQTTRVNDLRVAEYRGKPVLTWWQGRQVLGSGEGEVIIADQSYEKVAEVAAGNGYEFDFHEVRVTDRGTLLALVYNPIDADLSSVGGPKDGRVIDAIVQEVDIATGRVLFEWHSVDDIGFDASYNPVPEDRSKPFDYFHVNSVSEDDDGNLLISGRDTWQVVKVNRQTGELMWRLGGKKSEFEMSDEAVFAYQHDAQRDADGTIRMFDNEAAPKVRDASRLLWLKLDEENMTAEVARSIEHPEGLLSGTQGNVDRTAAGTVFAGWGSQGYFSEFTANGRMLFDARVARGNDSYRAYRQPWTGRPENKPAVAVRSGGGDGVEVYASWNGATEVAEWEVMAGASPDALAPVGSAERDGFETRIDVQTDAPVVAVRAKSASGAVLGTSEPAQDEDA